MLNLLRKKGVMKKLLWAVAIVIIISFGLLGRANLSDRNPRKSYAGKMFGKKVSFSKFQKSYQQANLQALMLYGKNFYKLRDSLNLISDSWDRLILLHEAKKRKIKVKEEEIVKMISSYPFFQRNNQFDENLYNNVLRNIFKMRPREFEEGVRDNLMIGRIYEQVTFPVSLTDEEILEKFKRFNDRIKVNYVLIPAASFKEQVSLNDAELKDFFEQNKKNFLAPPSINVEYLAFTIPKDTPEETKKAKKKELEEQVYDAYTDLIQETDLDPISQKFNIPVQITGFFNQGQINFKEGWSFELLQQAFQLDEGEVSEPVETNEGFYILKLKEKKGAYIPSFDAIVQRVKEALTWKKAVEIAQDNSKKNLEEIKKAVSSGNTDFAKITKDLGFELKQTPEFARGTYIPDMGIAEGFQEAAFTLDENNKLSDVVPMPKGFAILWFEAFIPASKGQFENDKGMLSQQLMAEKKTNVFGEFLATLRLKANLEDNVTKQEKENKKQ